MAQVLGGWKSRIGVQRYWGKAPVGDRGDEVLQKLKQFLDIV